MRGFAHIALVLFLLGAIPVTFYLASRPQIFKPKAYETIPIDSQLVRQDLRSKFKISDDIADSQVEEIVKDDLLKANIKVKGSIISGTAEVGLLGECFNEQPPNYLFSEYGVFPPICLDPEERAKIIKYALLGVEFIIDTVIAPFSMTREVTQEAIQWQNQAEIANASLKSTGLSDRVSTTPISKPDSGFNGYAVTLLRILELEEDVKSNPDRSGNLTLEQEEARREYLKNLRELWEKQHNATFKLVEATAYGMTFAPLKIVGKVVVPITTPLVSKLNEVTKGPRTEVYNFLKGAWERLTGKKADKIIEGVDPDLTNTGNLTREIRREVLDAMVGSIERRLGRSLNEWERYILEKGIGEQKKAEGYYENFAKEVGGKYVPARHSEVEQSMVEYLENVSSHSPRSFETDFNGIDTHFTAPLGDDIHTRWIRFPIIRNVGFIVYRAGRLNSEETVRLYRGLQEIKAGDRQLAPILRDFRTKPDGSMPYGQNIGIEITDIKDFINGSITLEDLVAKSSYSVTRADDSSIIFDNRAIEVLRRSSRIFRKDGDQPVLTDIESMMLEHVDYQRGVVYPSVFVSTTKDPLIANNKYGSSTTNGGVLVLDIPKSEVIDSSGLLGSLKRLVEAPDDEVYVIGEIKHEWIKGFIPALAGRGDEFLKAVDELDKYIKK